MEYVFRYVKYFLCVYRMSQKKFFYAGMINLDKFTSRNKYFLRY